MIETKYGTYEMLTNEKDSFILEQFESRYISEVYDKYTYILGDLSGGLLRLKGFSSDSKSKNYFHQIPDFLNEACAYQCGYFVLKRIKIDKINNDIKDIENE